MFGNKFNKLWILVVVIALLLAAVPVWAQEPTEEAVFASPETDIMNDVPTGDNSPLAVATEEAAPAPVVSVTIEQPELAPAVVDSDRDDTTSIMLFGLLLLAVSGIGYMVKKNNELAGNVRDYLPASAWKSVYEAGAQTAQAYAGKTPNQVDDKIVALIVEQIAAILKVEKNE